jgi:hypothetical protein
MVILNTAEEACGGGRLFGHRLSDIDRFLADLV